MKKRKKALVVACLLFVSFISILVPFGKTEPYEAAIDYNNALTFFQNTGQSDGKHISVYDGTIYFATSAKLAGTYASRTVYSTLGYDVTLTAGGKSISFAVKRGGSLSQHDRKTDGNGYEYLLYKIPTDTIISLAEKADPTNAATVLKQSKIKVQLDAIVTVRRNGVQGSVTEDGKGGLTESGEIYHVKNSSDLQKLKNIFSGHDFKTYYNIPGELDNFLLTLMYNVGEGVTVGGSGYGKGNTTVGGTTLTNILYKSGAAHKPTYRTMESFQLLDPGTNGLKLSKTGYYLPAGSEWAKSDGTPLSIAKEYNPKMIDTGAGTGNKGQVIYANWKKNPYSIKYNANGGTGTMENTSTTYDTDVNLRENGYSNPGYDFLGWATSANGPVVYADKAKVKNLTSAYNGTVNLYAVWGKKTYTITLDSDGAPVKGSEKYYEKYNDGNYSDQNATNKITSITKPQWPGYTFGGYYSSKKGTGTKYIDADGKILAGNTAFLNDTTLYAKWTANAYTIKFHANGGTGTMADMNVKFDDLVTLRTNTFRRTGYSFKGWATSANGDAVYTDKDTVKELTTTDNGVIDLYAVWEENIYTITLNGDGATTQGTEKYYEKYATGNYLKDTCASGETVGTITKPVKPGFVFHGYYSSREGLGTKYIDKDGKILSLSSPAYTEFASDTTLYAYWTPNQYTIKYDSNGGTGSMQDTVATYGVPVTLRTNTFSNEGKTFSGWSLTPDGPVVYENKELVTDLTMENGSVVMLYAQWTANRYIITLNDDGATFPGTTRYCEKYGVNNYATTDCTVAIASIIRPKKDGYIFNGYYTGKNGTGTKYIDANGKILCLSSPAYTEFKTDTTLYADWTVTEYTIAYDPNGGSGSIPTTFAYYEEDVSLEPNTFVHTGKSFVGWALTKMGPVVYKDKQTVRNLNTTNGETIMLYAVWKEDVYTITLNSDGAPIKGTTEYFEKYSIQNYKKHPDQSTEVITAITKPVWTGRVFMGYYTEKDGTGTQYIDANGKILTTSTTFVADTTLFAGWKNAEYMIKYDANGGTGTMANTSATYNADVELRKHAFIRTGYMFVGWATSSTGPVVYKDKEMVRNLTATNGDTVILYAVWERILVMISLDSQTGTDGTEAFFEKYGLNFYLTNALKDVISNITVPVKIGYSFGGYFAGGEGSGDAHIDANGNIKVPNTTYLKETSLFAKWLAKQFIITFNKQGGTQGSDSVTATYSQILPAADAPQRVGFTFKGYYTGTNGTGTKYYDEFVNTSIVYQQLKNLTLYAYWEDTFAPDITLNVSTGKWTKDPVTLTAYVVDNGVGLAGVEIYLINQDGSLTLVADATGLNGTKLKELTFVNTKEGVVRYKAVATDLNGNKSESYNTVYYDTKAPTGSVIEFDVNGTIFDIIIDITDISTGN